MRALLLGLLATPARLLLLAPAAAPPRCLRHALAPRQPFLATPRLARARLPRAMDNDDAYRTLGIPEDAGYDAITTAYDEAVERYAGDQPMLDKLDEAKDKVVNNMLSRRMAGAAASYEGSLALEDRKPPPKTPIWVMANNLRKKTVIIPSWRYAVQVIGLMGGMAVAAWVAPSTAQTTSLINTVSGMGFMYNRGESEVPRDDFGQIGEIRPMKPKPFALTCAITGLCWLFAFWRTNAILAPIALAGGGKPPKGLVTVLRTTFVSLSLMIPALLLCVNGFFDD